MATVGAWVTTVGVAAKAPVVGSSAKIAPTSPAAVRCDQPMAGSRRGIRPRSWAGISTSTLRAKQPQAIQPTATSAQANRPPWSGLVSRVGMLSCTGSGLLPAMVSVP